MASRCKGITAKDKRCKKTVSNGDYCHLHKSQEKDPIPPGLPSKVHTVMKRGPSQTDSKGHIYVYYVESDDKERGSYWKIGRTTQPVWKRLLQWDSAILKKSYSVKFNKMAERIVHLLLDDVRIYRYKHEDGYHSIYKNNGKPVYDSQRKPDLKLEARTKHVEWFISDWSHVDRVISDVVDYVNKVERKEKK